MHRDLLTADGRSWQRNDLIEETIAGVRAAALDICP
jgi:hypothetical protein